jgi:hypothetical protein
MNKILFIQYYIEIFLSVKANMLLENGMKNIRILDISLKL